MMDKQGGQVFISSLFSTGDVPLPASRHKARRAASSRCNRYTTAVEGIRARRFSDVWAG
ncbi:MAG: hypothetical protein JKY23_04330 [Nitrospinaceae bacterium]|nr:hypothetical protein [Nitrospinaceae bacterium]